MENNRECYHGAAVHPELTTSFLPEDFGINPDDLTEDSRRELDAYKKRNAAYQASWEQDGFIGTPVAWLDANAPTQFKTQQLAIAGGGESQTIHPKATCPTPSGSIQRHNQHNTPP